MKRGDFQSETQIMQQLAFFILSKLSSSLSDPLIYLVLKTFNKNYMYERC